MERCVALQVVLSAKMGNANPAIRNTEVNQPIPDHFENVVGSAEIEAGTSFCRDKTLKTKQRALIPPGLFHDALQSRLHLVRQPSVLRINQDDGKRLVVAGIRGGGQRFR